MSTAITHVQPGSIAQRLGLVAGDKLVSIAGEPIIDQIDYQALTAQERFDMMVEDAGGQTRTVHVRKEDWEPLGLTLDQTIVSKPRPCRNHCIFCFIDQMPPGMRKTLYVKDDDWRLSLMMGNYITMTNIDDHELDRIIRRKVSPLFVSVQCTDPDMRVKLLRNPNAAKIMDNLRLLKANGIRFHALRMPVFSEFYVLMFWNLSPIFLVSWDLITTPPGMLSAFLSRLRMPTPLILGLLVVFRFFPTMRTELKGVGRSMKNRGLTAAGQLLAHPVQSMEYVLVPFLLRVLQLADQLSVSAVARGAERPGVRGSYYEKRAGARDHIAAAACAIVTASYLVLERSMA